MVLDGVFNHVGRGFWAFQDVLRNRERSPYIDWFYIDLGGNSCYDDGLWYEGWEGNYDLVKLNLRKEAVVEHLLEAVRFWVQEFGIDGLRLDVAYCLDKDFYAVCVPSAVIGRRIFFCWAKCSTGITGSV